MTGRPTKLTPDRQKEICDRVRNGVAGEVAAVASGVNRSTFYMWKQKGERGDKPYCDFLDEVKKAEAEAEERAVKIIVKAALDGTWQASAWFLERKHADRWAKQKEKEVTLGEALDTIINEVAQGNREVLQAILQAMDAKADKPAAQPEQATQ